MIYLNMVGIILVTILIAYKLNYIIRNIKSEVNTNILKTFKTFLGWPIASIFGAVASLVLCVYEIPGYYIQLADLIFSIIIIAYIDIKWKIIPNFLTLSLLLSQLIAAMTFSQSYLSLWNVLISIIVLLVLMFVSKMTNEQIGMGDVKLITVINLVYGLSFTLYSLIISLVIMLLFSIPLLILKKIKLKSQIPFAPFYVFGVSVYIILNLI